MKLRHLESFDIRQTVDDAPADAQKWRPLTKPAPALQGPWAEAPAPRQLHLIEMTYVHRDHSKHVEGMRSVPGGLWDSRWGEGVKTGVKAPGFENGLATGAALKVEPVIAGALVFNQDAVRGIVAKQLPNALACIRLALDLRLMEPGIATAPGIVQRLDDKGLLVGEGVLLISNHARSETRTENKPDSFRSKPVIATAKGGIERSFIERDLSD
jgi:hypothetical protein